jgi:hypothetical protein
MEHYLTTATLLMMLLDEGISGHSTGKGRPVHLNSNITRSVAFCFFEGVMKSVQHMDVLGRGLIYTDEAENHCSCWNSTTPETMVFTGSNQLLASHLSRQEWAARKFTESLLVILCLSALFFQ